MMQRKYNNIFEKKSIITKKIKEKNITQKNLQVFFFKLCLFLFLPFVSKSEDNKGIITNYSYI